MSEKPPQQIAAEEAAAKREAHKPRTLQHKVWRAVHDPVKGWHVALVDCPHHLALIARQAATQAVRAGDVDAFMRLAGEALLARCKAVLSDIPDDASPATPAFMAMLQPGFEEEL